MKFIIFICWFQAIGHYLTYIIKQIKVGNVFSIDDYTIENASLILIANSFILIALFLQKKLKDE